MDALLRDSNQNFWDATGLRLDTILSTDLHK